MHNNFTYKEGQFLYIEERISKERTCDICIILLFQAHYSLYNALLNCFTMKLVSCFTEGWICLYFRLTKS